MLDFFELLLKNKFISNIWRYVLEMIDQNISDDLLDKQQLMNLFTIYFSLIDDGNTTISLDEKVLKSKWQKKIEAVSEMLMQHEEIDLSQIDQIKQMSNICIDQQYLSKINEDDLSSVVGSNKIFVVSNQWLYLRKYDSAKRKIAKAIEGLFTKEYNNSIDFDYRKCTKDDFGLSEKQEEVVKKGINKNLIITGGPGTGKTTCVLFLLIALLENSDKNYNIYLVAPSGKAASRMKESISSTLDCVSEKYKEQNRKLFSIIDNLQQFTIHRLLEVDSKTSRFNYNEKHQFSSNSIFIIDEASMIDICLFSSLLESIQDDSRVFIMGDKNQLPSVESGAVFSALLDSKMLIKNGNIIELDESRRFSKDTEIYALASAINKGEQLVMAKDKWQDYKQFKIEKTDRKKCPIFYYQYYNSVSENKEIINYICNIWANEYYREIVKKATGIKLDDKKRLDELYEMSLQGKILSAENLGYCGARSINNFIKNMCVDKSVSTDVLYQYPGQIMMINTNNKVLDLYNGDNGIIVTLENSSIAYFMVKKSSLIQTEDGYKENRIFKIGEYLFYPLRLISQDEIDLAYAITIHKSQGSDYNNILVVLPNRIGHPLLNRQIIYTAITRTKGNTYILANQELLQKGCDNRLIRDCNIFQ